MWKYNTLEYSQVKVLQWYLRTLADYSLNVKKYQQRYELAMDNLTRNPAPKFTTIKTSASLVERNRPAFVEIEVAGKIFQESNYSFPKSRK